MVTLLASAARTAAGTSVITPPIRHPELLRSARFLLDVTVAATQTGDLLDMWVQQSYDGTNYDDVARFTQVVGDGGAKKYIAEWTRDVTPESEMHAPSDAAIAAGVVQGGKLGLLLRLKWTVTDVSTDDASFTFSVSGEFEYRR